jgi:hypothetical protein
VTLSTLHVPEVTRADLLTGMALSPTGREFATAVLTGKNRAVSRVSVYSVATGAVRSWQSKGTLGYNPYDPSSISLSRSGTLAFNWVGPAPTDGIYLLNTRAAAGGLLAHSRFTVAAVGRVWHFNDGGVLTADGTRIVAPMWRPSAPSPGAAELEEFSAATGKPVEVLHRMSASLLALAWTNSNGSVLVAAAPVKPGQLVFGVVAGRNFLPLPKAPAVFGQTDNLAF